MSKDRNWSLDLLRIIGMLMIVMLHLLYKGGALFSSNIVTKDISWLLEAFSVGAVNIYILISGYFLYDSDFKWKKVIKLWSAVLFYTVLILILFIVFGISVSKKEILFSIFPVTTRTGYWFITCYILLYILSPFLNVCLKNIKKKQHFNLCLTLFIVFSVINTFLPIESCLDSTNGYSIIWMMIVYVYATYLKKYYSNYSGNNQKNYWNLVVYFISSFCIFLAYIICNRLNINMYERFYWYNSVLCLISAISIFVFFKNLQLTKKSLISCIKFFAPLTFGVYLIHENILIRQYLYLGLYNVEKYGKYGISGYIVILFFLLILLYVSTSFIEWLRVKLFELLKKCRLFNKLDNKLVVIISKVDNYITHKFGLNEKHY